MANVIVEDGLCLAINPCEKNLIPAIEKAILKSHLGLNPATSGETIRLPMPALTEETRKQYIKQARAEAEKGRVYIRNMSRGGNGKLKDLDIERESYEEAIV